MAIQRRGRLWESTIDLSAAQVRSWHTTPIEAAPAPGVNRLLVPDSYLFIIAPGTTVFSTVPGLATDISALLGATAIDTIGSIQALLGATTAKWTTFLAQPQSNVDLSATINAALTATTTRAFSAGAIATATLNAAGLGYAANDTGTVDPNSNGTATYTVLTVGALGAVATFSITNRGSSYSVANGLDTDTDGAGTGFKVNITGITPGNGTMRMVTRYATTRVS